MPEADKLRALEPSGSRRLFGRWSPKSLCDPGGGILLDRARLIGQAGGTSPGVGLATGGQGIGAGEPGRGGEVLILDLL